MSQPAFQQFCAWGFDHPSLVEHLGVGEPAPDDVLEQVLSGSVPEENEDRLPVLLGRLQCRPMHLSGKFSANEDFVKAAYSHLCSKQQEQTAEEQPSEN